MWPILVIVHPQTALGALRSHGATPQGAGGRPASTRGDPPGERKIDNKTRIVLLDAFVGRCGGIARRENGAGFVQFRSACADNVGRAPPGAACASIVFLKQTFFYKNNSTTNHKPRPLPPRRPSPAPPPPPPPSIATRRPPTADHRPPTAYRRPPRRRQAKRTSSRRHRPGCRGGADGRRETIERRALDAADDLVAVRASVLRVGKNKRF